jgi:uncharacterized protein (TIGR03089 family)
VPPPNDTPTALLAGLVERDPTRPRLTWYDDHPGPTQGERIEISGKVLGNWAAKAANLLQEELEVGPGSVLALDLPVHWRAAYWLFAAWSVGAEVVIAAPDIAPDADVLVTADPSAASNVTGPVVAVTLAALARSWPGAPLSAGVGGVVDEAKELATYGDRFQAWAAPAPDATALRTAAGSWTYAELVPAARAAAAAAGLDDQARVMTSAGPAEAVPAWLSAWVVDGSLVLVRPSTADTGTDTDRDTARDRRAEAERVTARL